jgi:hypothetical protein
MKRHWCCLCHQKHPLGDRECELFFERVNENNCPSAYCLDWNTDGSCGKAECADRHHCLYCSSTYHASFECEHSLETMIVAIGNGVATLPSNPKSKKPALKSPSTGSDHGKRGATPCYHFNKAVEYGCKLGSCPYAHVCAICGGDHAFMSCPLRDFCLEFTKTGTCRALDLCSHRHWCLLFHERHPFGDPLCSRFSVRIRVGDNPLSYCL